MSLSVSDDVNLGSNHRLHCSFCLSPRPVRIVREDVGPWLLSSFLSSPHVPVTAFSITRLQLLMSFAVVLHSPLTLSRSVLSQSSRRIFSHPRLLFPSFLGICSFCQFIIFVLKRSFTPASILFSFLIRPLHSHDSSYPAVLLCRPKLYVFMSSFIVVSAFVFV